MIFFNALSSTLGSSAASISRAVSRIRFAFFVRNDVLSFLRWHELPHGNATKTNAPTAIINMIITPIPTNNAKAFSRRRSRASFSALRVSSPNMQLAPQMIAMLRF
jgi:hypothetical protein